MLIPTTPVFNDLDNEMSITWTTLDPGDEWNDDTLISLRAGTILIQVGGIGGRNAIGTELDEVWVKAASTPTTVGYNGDADWRPLASTVVWGTTPPLSSSATYSRLRLGSIAPVTSAGNFNLAFVKLTDTSNDAGCTDWYRIPIALCNSAIVAGGAWDNYAFSTDKYYGFIGGGETNLVDADSGGIVAGLANTVTGDHGFIGAGRDNNVAGINSAVVAGVRNSVTGDYSTAVGTKILITHDDAILINGLPGASYANDTDSFDSAARGEIGMRASGYRIYTNLAESTGVTMAGGASSWSAVSDERTKSNIAELTSDVLAGYRRLRSVSYTQGEDWAGAGVTAQDYYKAFPWLVPHKIGDMLALSQAERDGVQDAALSQMARQIEVMWAKIQELEARCAGEE